MAERRPISSMMLPCSICQIDIGHQTCQEYPYMVHDSLWRQVCEEVKPQISKKGYLCIGCLEARLGRQLTHKDFNDAPINSVFLDGFQRSVRLMQRQLPTITIEFPNE